MFLAASEEEMKEIEENAGLEVITNPPVAEGALCACEGWRKCLHVRVQQPSIVIVPDEPRQQGQISLISSILPHQV